MALHSRLLNCSCLLYALQIAFLCAASIANAQPKNSQAEMEIKNDQGSAIGVHIKPSISAYTVNGSGTASGFEHPGDLPSEGSVQIPTSSYMLGLTVSAASTGDVSSCAFSISYPNDPSDPNDILFSDLRPLNQEDAEFMSVILAPPVDNIHVPLANLFVGEGVSLQYDYSAIGLNEGDICRFNWVLQLRPFSESTEP